MTKTTVSQPTVWEQRTLRTRATSQSQHIQNLLFKQLSSPPFVGFTQCKCRLTMPTLCLTYRLYRVSAVSPLQNNSSSAPFQNNFTQSSFRLSLPPELTHAFIRIHTGARGSRNWFLEPRRPESITGGLSPRGAGGPRWSQGAGPIPTRPQAPSEHRGE